MVYIAEHQAAREQRRAGQVGSRGEASPSRSGTSLIAEQRRRQPDREVDEEDPVPIDRLGEHTAEQEPDRAAGDRDEGVDRRSPSPAPGAGNIVTIMPRITAEVSAPPMPWTKRAPISNPGSARAHRAATRR